MMSKQLTDFNQFIDDIRQHFNVELPEQLEFFEIYIEEAKFAYNIFASSLDNLPEGANILEVGAGMMLLSCQLCINGYKVTALEPVGEGFSHFLQMQRVVLEYADQYGCRPNILESTAESLELVEQFDFALSSNVMEHVEDIELSLRNISRALTVGSEYRFICPNYAFPYEPHFNMITFGSKSLTARIMKNTIANTTLMPDPEDTWKSLNWITVSQVRKIGKKFNTKVNFHHQTFEVFLDRALSDPLFRARRGKLIVKTIETLYSLGFFKLVRLIPRRILPIMDCSFFKSKA